MAFSPVDKPKIAFGLIAEAPGPRSTQVPRSRTIFWRDEIEL